MARYFAGLAVTMTAIPLPGLALGQEIAAAMTVEAGPLPSAPTPGAL